MAIEDAVTAVLKADVALKAILTGGIYTSGTVGSLGITRETTPAAFDTYGFLKPSALVRQRGLVPDGVVRDGLEQTLSTAQIVEIWLYQDTGGYDAIDAAAARIYTLLEGVAVEGTYPLELINQIDRERDEGALNGASLARLDFAVYSVIGA